MTIHVNGSLTRSMSPGDVVEIGGNFLPIPYTGFQAIRAGLLTDTYLEAHHVHQLKKQYNEMAVTQDIYNQLMALMQDPQLYDKLARSIAPEIYGHVDVKKALLLLLVGGVTKDVGDGMKIRGQVAAPHVHFQGSTSRCLYHRQGFLRCWIDGGGDARPGDGRDGLG
jgi:DNA replication licensing factor MCM7